MEKYCDTNLNYYIKVKLTEEGRIFYKKHYEKYNCEAPKLNIDDEGYVQFQIHDFMNIFGERLFMGATLPCETNCKIQVKDDWHYVKDRDLPKKDSELLYEKFDNEIKVYKFLNKVSKDKPVRVIAITRLSGPEEGNFELFYKIEDKMATKEELENEIKELKESYYVNRCLHSGCPYLHIDNRNCTKFGGFFTSVSNKDCPMMKNLNANIKLANAKEVIEKLLKTPRTIWKRDEDGELCPYANTEYSEIEKQAEQFLMSV